MTGKWLKEVAKGSVPVKWLRKWMKEAANERGQWPGRRKGRGRRRRMLSGGRSRQRGMTPVTAEGNGTGHGIG